MSTNSLYSCHAQDVSQKFLDLDTVTIYAYVSYTLVLSILELLRWAHHLSHCWKDLCNSRFMMLSNTACVSDWILAISSNHRPFNLTSILIPCYDLTKMFLFFLSWSCRSFIQKVGFVDGQHLTQMVQILQLFVSCLNFSVKTYQNVKYNVPRMLQISLIISCLPSWMTWHIYHVSISASWWWPAWTFKINNQNLATFEM